MNEYKDTVLGQIEEKVQNGWLKPFEARYLKNNVDSISKTILEKLKDNTPLDEELELIDDVFLERLEEFKDMKNTYCLSDLRLSEKLKEFLESKGYFCYELGDQSLYGKDVIAKKVVFNNIGSIITSKPLEITNENQTLDLYKTISEMEEMPEEERIKIFFGVSIYNNLSEKTSEEVNDFEI